MPTAGTWPWFMAVTRSMRAYFERDEPAFADFPIVNEGALLWRVGIEPWVIANPINDNRLGGVP